MSDTVKLIVTISKDQYEICKQALKDFGDRPITECEFVIAVGTPLDDVKEQMKKTRRFHVGTFEDDNPIDYGIVEGFDKAIAILDNIGKAESED